MAVKGLIASVVQLLTQQLEDGDLSDNSRESLEVAIQCLESAYNVQASDALPNINLLELYQNSVDNAKPDFGPPATPEAKAEAERLKNEGNNLMKAEKHHEALANYTKAIQLDSRNAVYYCNRAAVHSKIGNHAQAIKDCHTALAIDPSYSKAYGRLGLAYSSLDKHKEAKQSYQKALEMEPGNESYKMNLQLSEEKLAQQGVGYMVLGNNSAGGAGGAAPNMDLSSLLSNPALRNMARLMLSDPGMQNMMSDLMSGNVEQGGRMEALIEAGQQLAQQMQSANPDLIDSLRRQMGGNPNDPEPPQEN
ncbi:small glutamine-rich tetratricopeptide repeat-containing protein alpha-like [Diprion similis]|uniref:small glutamine-rich tetratricopeptide repeat-containing protein alpha-like n=1 Tax=Diprion similis TaxID=362088 RepID=UPI001EF79F1C|nr:small glutamine-rich tetratricopeptide repeat-containing protein alpha-like [Diprion similis]XP_046747237.1 small glutamine-rich tetratricopeptide repeat-containing protein alpha-like [Diprion similis]XP_046747238.1 small glutamine-rich tetratricopeptide repeat-containing protein alpha-like [Diprion similis]